MLFCLLKQQLSKGFKKPVYWNEYKTKIESIHLNTQNPTRICLGTYFQGFKKLFVLVFSNTDYNENKVERNSYRKYFLLRVNITNYNVLIDGRKFYDIQQVFGKIINTLKTIIN